MQSIKDLIMDHGGFYVSATALFYVVDKVFSAVAKSTSTKTDDKIYAKVFYPVSVFFGAIGALANAKKPTLPEKPSDSTIITK